MTPPSANGPGRSPRVLIAAGGTAGHVVPSLAVAAELTARGADVVFAGTAERIEARLVPAAGYPLHTYHVTGLPAAAVARPRARTRPGGLRAGGLHPHPAPGAARRGLRRRRVRGRADARRGRRPAHPGRPARDRRPPGPRQPHGGPVRPARVPVVPDRRSGAAALPADRPAGAAGGARRDRRAGPQRVRPAVGSPGGARVRRQPGGDHDQPGRDRGLGGGRPRLHRRPHHGRARVRARRPAGPPRTTACCPTHRRSARSWPPPTWWCRAPADRCSRSPRRASRRSSCPRRTSRPTTSRATPSTSPTAARPS